MSVKDIAGLIPTMQGVALASHNYNFVNKKKKSTKDFIGMGMTNIVGTSMIKINADLVAGL